jgi:hypothetical protein
MEAIRMHGRAGCGLVGFIPGRDLCGIVVGTKMGPQMGPQRGKPRLEDSVTYFKPSRPR